MEGFLLLCWISFFQQVNTMETSFLLHAGQLHIPCKLTQPEGTLQRVVLGVHGLTGSMDDTIQSGIAEEMALFYAATFRFDLPAHGKNPEETLTVQGCVDTLLAVAAEARRRYPNVEDLCIFATGFGAYITLLALPKLTGRIKLVIQTPALLMHETILSMINRSRETFWAMESITLPTPRPLTLTYRFYEELEQNIALAAYSVPMLMLYGQDDPYIRSEAIAHFRRLNGKSKQVTIPGASHRFQEDGAWDMVLDLTRDWFEFEQVLLTDCD